MKIKPSKVEIPPEAPFANDLLARGEFAGALTELVASVAEPFVFCINAAWGEGKTTFLMMWRQHLINNGFSTLYYNAWENDFSDNALVSLMGELETGLDDLLISKHSIAKVRKQLQKVKRIGSRFLKKAIPATVKIATAGVVDVNETMNETISNLTESIVSEQIKIYEESKRSISTFKQELEKFANEISITTDPQRPLIIIIDELDRCRPTYAIEVLEKAKHFFGVKNIVFVMAVDKSQMGHSIKSVYGTGMDVNGYLKRFIDLEFYFTNPKDDGAFSKAMFYRFGLKTFFEQRAKGELQYEQNHLLETFQGLFKVLELSLREQEQCFSQLVLAIKTTPPNYKLYPFLLATLITIKIKRPDLYKRFITRQLSGDSIVDHIRSLPGGPEFLDGDNYGAVLESYLVACTSSRHDGSTVLSRYSQVEGDPAATEDQKKRARYILHLLSTYEARDAFGCFDYVLKKMEITSQFTAN